MQHPKYRPLSLSKDSAKYGGNHIEKGRMKSSLNGGIHESLLMIFLFTLT